ncbi:hypothetical protein [Oceanithermus sp.]
MAGLMLSVLLTLAPLPGLPALPDGAEIRVVSPNLRTIYLYWRVDHGVLDLRADPLDPPEGAAVRILVRTGRELHAYEGRVWEDDIYVLLDDGYVSLRDTFREVYQLRESDRTQAVWKKWEERRRGGGETQPNPPDGGGHGGAGGNPNTGPHQNPPGPPQEPPRRGHP